MDITKLSEEELRQEIRARTNRIMTALEKLVEAGRGADKCEDISKMGDELSLEYNAADESLDEIFAEARRRTGLFRPEDRIKGK